MEARLTVEAGLHPGKSFPLPENGTFTIGRDTENDYAVPIHSKLSRVHCKIENKGGGLSITDLDSKNGTFVNGQRIESRALRDNDLIEVGRIRLRIRIGVEEEKKHPTPPEPIIAIRRPRRETAAAAASAPTAARVETQPLPRVGDELALVGKVVDTFKVVAVVARSKRGFVYKAIEPSKNRLVALKILSAELAKDPEGVRWFTEGARHAGSLKHDDLVPVLGGGRLGETYYCATLFMARGSALTRFRRVTREGVEAVRLALQTVIHAARALEFGSQHEILHRGVRPSKILYDENQMAKLNGLGFDNGPGPGFDPARAGTAAAFLAPEQFREPVSQMPDGITADIYGLGGCFYFMLTGQPPQRDAKGALKSPKLLNRAVPDSICRIAERMLEVEPKQRYNTYGHLLHDLRWALRGEIWPRR